MSNEWKDVLDPQTAEAIEGKFQKIIELAKGS
jgi:hypothetical protein